MMSSGSSRTGEILSKCMRSTAAALIALALCTPAVAAPTLTAAPKNLTAAQPLPPLGAGDVVTVQVFGRPELTTNTYVADDGGIDMPLVGSVQVSGLSPTKAAQRIAAAFKRGQYLRNPQVTLLVTQSRSQRVSVLGEVRNPGRYVLEGTTTILDLLALAGGTNERGASTVYLIRADDKGQLTRHPIDLNGLNDDRQSLQLLALRGGDSVYVPVAQQFYIYGAVQAPNMYRLEPSMTVLQAISRGGGPTRVANDKRVEIRRRNADGTIVTLQATLAEPVQPDDVIHVRESLF
ncbi:MAG TPA: SLBB domain-containing protein [Povalibacter sp.]|nr:SLBB domain-containing protein [Povalibacter sp.]